MKNERTQTTEWDDLWNTRTEWRHFSWYIDADMPGITRMVKATVEGRKDGKQKQEKQKQGSKTAQVVL